MAHPKQIQAGDVMQAAMALLEEAGRNGLSLRVLAARLGVKAPSLYHHFADKRALEAALVEEGNRLLLEAIRSGIYRKRRRGAFVALAVSYMTFAQGHPELYAFLMHGKPASSGSGKALWNLVLRMIQGISGEADDTSMAVAFWSFLHGFAMLERAGRFGDSGPAEGFGLGLEAFVEKMEGGRGR